VFGSPGKLINYVFYYILQIFTENFDNLPNLIDLDLSNNHFSNIPDGISKLKKLQVLNLGVENIRRYALTYQLGSELTSLINMKHLILSGLSLDNLSRYLKLFIIS
jgi:Leucine-rich repeat (LRR) protein